MASNNGGKKKQKRRKRVHSGGSVYPRSDGRWAADFIVEETGKRKTLYARTETEAIEKRQQALFEQKQGKLVTGPKQKLGDYLDQWLEDVHKPAIRASSYVKYRLALDKHIIPDLGQIALQKLTPDHIQSFYAKKLKEGLKPQTVHVYHAILHRALDNAVRWKRVNHNVCDLVSLPRARKFEIQPLTEEQAQTLIEAVKGHKLEGLIIIALLTGAREGELLALRWKDIDFAQSLLSIRRSVSYVSGQGYVEEEPKTSRGRRVIPLPQIAVDVLQQHRNTQRRLRLKAGTRWVEHDLVFPNRDGGFMNTAGLWRSFHTLLKKAGLSHIRFHDLRHSAATLLLKMGVHPKIVQERLGHAQISMTMDIYSHVLPTMQKDASDKLDDMFRHQNP